MDLPGLPVFLIGRGFRAVEKVLARASDFVGVFFEDVRESGFGAVATVLIGTKEFTNDAGF